MFQGWCSTKQFCLLEILHSLNNLSNFAVFQMLLIKSLNLKLELDVNFRHCIFDCLKVHFLIFYEILHSNVPHENHCQVFVLWNQSTGISTSGQAHKVKSYKFMQSLFILYLLHFYMVFNEPWYKFTPAYNDVVWFMFIYVGQMSRSWGQILELLYVFGVHSDLLHF